MGDVQLPIFKQKSFGKVVQRQLVEPVVPTGEMSLMQTLPAFQAYVGERYADKTARMYFGDVKELSIYLKDKKLKDITSLDLRQWISVLLSPSGKKLTRKTVNRKVSAVITYFLWLRGTGAIAEDPAGSIKNTRIQSPLPDYLYEQEVKALYTQASHDPRIYLLVLLFLEAGIKSNELFGITKAHVDTSDPYNPELWIKHSGKQTRKDRKVALPQQFTKAYQDYIAKYNPEDNLFTITDRFVQMLFADLKKQTKIDKELTPKTLRHTHVVQALRRGEDIQKIFDRLGYAEDSRQAAEEMYRRIAGRGI
jgi:integrase/recombinase XerC